MRIVPVAPVAKQVHVGHMFVTENKGNSARDRAQALAEKGICGGTVSIVEEIQRWRSEDIAWVLTCCTYPLVSPAEGEPVL
jgi:hypothetical protein